MYCTTKAFCKQSNEKKTWNSYNHSVCIWTKVANKAHEGFDRIDDQTPAATHAAPQATSPVLQTNLQLFVERILTSPYAIQREGSDGLLSLIHI